MKFSIRTLMLLVGFAALMAFASSCFLQPDYTDTLSGYYQIGEHVLVRGSDETGVLWSIVFPNDKISSSMDSDTKSGFAVTVDGQFLTVTGNDGMSKLRLRDGIAYVYRSPDSITVIETDQRGQAGSVEKWLSNAITSD